MRQTQAETYKEVLEEAKKLSGELERFLDFLKKKGREE